MSLEENPPTPRPPAVPPFLPPARPRCGRTWLWVFLALSLLANAGFYAYTRFLRAEMSSGEETPFQERYLTGKRDSKNQIAVVRVEGLIAAEVEGHMGYDGMVGDIREQLRLATEDEEVKAIILRVDSPGGEVLASDEIYRMVREARKHKPVVCSMGSLAASGGYYAAMGANWVIADELTITGSIGVIMQTLNYKDLFGKIGLKSVVFKSGRFKDILNGSRDATPEEVELVQALIMETYDQFLNVVATERKMDPQQLRNNLADGRIFSGRQALAVKLVDQNGNFQDAVKKAMQLGKVSEAGVFDYTVPFSLKNILGLFAKSQVPRIAIEPLPASLKLQQGKLYYLSFHLF